MARAGWPLADVSTIRLTPAPCREKTLAVNRAVASRPENQVRLGGISVSTSSRNRHDEPVHVRRFERPYVTLQHLPQVRVSRVEQVVFRRRQLVQLGSGSLEGTVYGGRAGIEQLGYFSRPPRQYFAQQKHGPLLGRQVLQSSHKRQPYGVASDRQVGGVGGRGQPNIGYRLKPRDFSVRRPQSGFVAWGAQVRRQGPGSAGPQPAEAGIGGYFVEPRAHAALGRVEPPVSTPRPDQGLLHHVLGLAGGAQHAVTVGYQLASERFGQPYELLVQFCLSHAHWAPTGWATAVSTMSSTDTVGWCRAALGGAHEPAAAPSSDRPAQAQMAAEKPRLKAAAEA